MKKIFGAPVKRVICLSMVVIMLTGLVTVSAASTKTALTAQHYAMLALSNTPSNLVKDETVYAILDLDGSINSVSVVNRINTPSEGLYTDFGNYTDIKNLSNESQPQIEGGKVIWNLPASNKGFYYEGTPKNAELPFTFSIIYTLDGVVLDAKELIGKSGKIEIQLKIVSNAKTNSYFAENYLAQVQLPLSLDKCSNIVAEGAQSVIVGSTNTLAHMVFPGSTKEFTVAFDAKDFEMNGITATVTPVDMKSLIGLDGLDVNLGSTEEMTEGTGALVSGTEQLKVGISQLADGLKTMVAGVAKLTKGSSDFKKGLEAYTGGIGALSESANQLSQGLGQLGQNGGELSNGYTQISGGAAQLLDGLLAGLPAEQQAAYAPQVERLKQQLQGYGGSLTAYTQGVSQTAQGLTALSGGLSAVAQKSPELLKGATQINEGLTQLGYGLSALYEGARLIPNEIQKLIDGQKKLKEGIEDALSLFDGFNLEGGNAGEPVSFVDSSQAVRSVQFVIKTPELKIQVETAPPITVQEPKNFWEKLVALFTL